MSNLVNPSTFNELVLTHYKFLINDYGFSMTKENDWSYKFENLGTRISVFLEQSINLVIEIEPIGESARQLLRQNILPSRLDVVTVSMCLDLELKYKIKKISATNIATDVFIEMEKRAFLIKKYCLNLLQGNYEDWPRIQTCMSKRAREFLNIL